MRSHEVARLVGISFRQLDYLTRRGVVRGFSTGSGKPRTWPPELVVRLALANHLVRAIPGDTTKPFPDVAEMALAVPEDPPRRGYVVQVPDPDTIAWTATWADVRRLMDDYGAALIVRYDLDELLGDDFAERCAGTPAKHLHTTAVAR